MKFTNNLNKSPNKSYCCGKIILGWHPRILALLITVALGLSIVSSLDCRYIIVDLGFTPQRYFDDKLAFGLWAYSAPGGRCLSYSESRQIGLFSEEDMTYTSLLMNGDINWTIARILALVGVAFGSIALVSYYSLLQLMYSFEHILMMNLVYFFSYQSYIIYAKKNHILWILYHTQP